MQVFNPERILDVAEHLAARDGEESVRSAISRAYYGAFLMARDIADITDEDASAHVKTWQHYRNRGEKQIAKDLRELRRARNLADYKTHVHVPSGLCETALQSSRRVRLALQRIMGRDSYWNQRVAAAMQ